MKKFLSIVLAAVALFAYSCSYDDSGLIDRIENLENRVEKLEQACKDINSNIEALQALVKALQENDYVTSVTPITENGEVVGYTINFVKGDPITIYHGEDGQNGADGKDGYTPQIGVREDVDGVIYWTIDGDWLLDENGNKVKAVGADGADGTDGVDGQNGTTPSLKIEEGYWYVSLDGGATWTELGKATGEDGKDGADGDSMFEGIEQDDNYVYVYLSDGTTLILPKAEISLATIDTAAYYTFTKANKVEAGEWYLIVADGKAAQPVAADKGYGYLAVANVEDKDGVINTLGAYAFGVMPANGGYTLMQPDGRLLYQSGNYNSFNVNAKPNEGFVWSITANEDGTFKILNNSVNKYVQFDSEFTSYGSYADARGTMPVLYKLTGEGVAPEPEPEPEIVVATVAEFLAAAEDDTVYELTGTIANVVAGKTYYGNFDLVDETGSVYVYGIVDEAGERVFESLGLKAGDTITLRGTRQSFNGNPQMKDAVYVSHVASVVETEDGIYTSDAAFVCSADDSTNSAYGLGETVIDNINVSGFKLGTSKKAGYFASSAVGVSGNYELSFYAVAWKGKTATLYVRVDGGEATSFELNANDGATGNAPYTALTFTENDYYTVTLNGLTENSIVEFSTDASFSAATNSSARAIVCGVQFGEQPVVKELSFTKASLFSTTGAYTIRFTNDDESQIMFLYFYSDKNYVPAGTYTDGYNNGNFSGAQSYVYLANSDERLNYTSGSITVDLTEDNVYTFTFNDLVFGDKDIKGSWSGKIDGLAQPVESPAVVFTNAKYLMDGYGSSAYQFTNEEGWQLNLYFDTAHSKPLQAGTYNSTNYCNGGWQWDNYDTKLTIPASASSTGSRETGLKFTDGTVVVALDGDTYTVTMDMTLAKDKSNFKASFTGTIAQ